MKLAGGGTTLKRIKEHSAIPVSTIISGALSLLFISEMTFIPIILESVYPTTCDMMRSVLKSIPWNVIPLNSATVKDFLMPYIQA